MVTLEDRGRAVDRFEMVDVRTYAFRAEARETSRDPDLLPSAPEHDGEIELTTAIELEFADGQAEARMPAVFGLVDSAVQVDLGARFVDRDPEATADDAMREALAHIAAEVLYPYIRELVASMTVRLDHPVTLGLLKIGEVTLARESHEVTS